MTTELNKCLYPDCEKESYSRGLCNTHYGIAGKAVKNGKATWEDLEKLGKSLPLKKLRTVASWFVTKT